MELAKNLTLWRDQTPEQWIALANRWLPPLVAAALVVLIAYQASNLTWRLLERPAAQDAVPPIVIADDSGAASRTAASIDAAYGLFGQAPAPDAMVTAVDPFDADETTLNLTLTGIVAAQELPERGSTVIPDAGAAIIGAGRGQQKTYWTGDEIQGANGAWLEGVFTDRVLLRERDGRTTRLTFDLGKARQTSQMANSRLTTRSQAARSTAQVSAPTTRSAASDLADAISSTAMTLGEHMSIQPQVDDGQVTGYRIQPVNDSSVFSEFGFEPGDVLTEINGLRVNDVRNSQAVWQALSETNMAEIRIQRNGSSQILNVDMSKIQQLGESQQ